MKTELLTGTPGNVTAEAKKLLGQNPNWQIGEFGATANSKGESRVALAMHLGTAPRLKVADLTISTGTEKTVKTRAASLAREHPNWNIRRFTPYFATRGDKETPCAAILFIKEQP